MISTARATDFLGGQVAWWWLSGPGFGPSCVTTAPEAYYFPFPPKMGSVLPILPSSLTEQ